MPGMTIHAVARIRWHREISLSAGSGSVSIAGKLVALEYSSNPPGTSEFEIMAEGGASSSSGTAATFDVIMPADSSNATVVGAAATFGVIMPAASANVSTSGTAAGLIEPEVSFNMSIPATGYTVSFTDTSTMGGEQIDLWEWRIAGSSGDVQFSFAQHPTIDMAADGPGDYDVFLTVTAGIVSQTAQDSFTLNAPATTDDVALGYPTVVSTNAHDERITVPIVRARDKNNVTLTAPSQVQIRITADGIPVYGPKIWDWGTDLGDLTDPFGSYLFAGTLAEGGSLSFDSQGDSVKVYEVRFVTQGADSVTHIRTINNPQHYLLRTAGSPVGTEIGLGSSRILNNNVPTPWAASDVIAHGGFIGEQYLQRLRQTDSNIWSTDIGTRKTTYPKTEGVSVVRFDLAHYGPGAYQPGRTTWGDGTLAHPTLAMGSTPRTGRVWNNGTASDMVTILASAGYVQDATNKANTDDELGNNTITNPYRIILNPGAGTWSIQDHEMDVTNPDWLDLVTDAFVIWRAQVTGMAGYQIGPAKIQWTFPNAPAGIQRFSAWVDDNANPGWDLATDTGGQPGIESWGSRTKYDWVTYRILDILEASWEVVRLLRAKDPNALILYDPLPAHVSFGVGTQSNYESQWISDNGGTAADAKDYYVERQHEMRHLADYLFPTESAAPSLGLDYIPLADRNRLRHVHAGTLPGPLKWVRYMNNPQTNIT